MVLGEGLFLMSEAPLHAGSRPGSRNLDESFGLAGGAILTTIAVNTVLFSCWSFPVVSEQIWQPLPIRMADVDAARWL